MTHDNLPGSEFLAAPRLVNVGEPVTFTLRGSTARDRFEVFPRYLERCDPERARRSPQPLQWLDEAERESFRASDVIRYVPRAAGNYLARWTSEHQGTQYRYFAAIDQSCHIYRPTVWSWPTMYPAAGGPEIHNGGLPLDWCLSSDDTAAPYVPRLIVEQQRYGGGIVYGTSPAPKDRSRDDTVRAMKDAVAGFRRCGLEVGRVCNLWYGNRLSNVRVEAARAAGFDVIDGYVPRADSCGMGAPYFPFYIGPTDHRFPSQQGPTDAVSCVFDFVGSWHFHGPIGFHRPSARGSWERARFAIDLAAREAALTALNSGTHNFITTLINFESPAAWGAKPYEIVWDEERGREFFENYMHLLAFEHTRRWPIVFARAVDYADYFRAHYTEMPRRIVSSVTHDIEYDRFWTDEWHEQNVASTGYVPVDQPLRAFREARVMPQYNMPMSLEFMNYNDNRRTCRFEYACPKPLHYYDLTGSTAWPERPVETDLPDPDVAIAATTTRSRHEISLQLASRTRFPDYLMALWDIPREFRDSRVTTNAKEFIWVQNTDGNYRGIVRFDLEPQTKVTVAFVREKEAS